MDNVLWFAELPINGRRRHLFACMVAKLAYDIDHLPWFREAISFAEQKADRERTTHTADEIRIGMSAAGDGGISQNWQVLAWFCVTGDGMYTLGSEERSGTILADTYRELVANPFLPLAWNPNWFTSTVRELAAHIYEQREFGTMPILADALQDAGCADEQILTHCRADKPHARGCWVLDAILGKE